MPHRKGRRATVVLASVTAIVLGLLALPSGAASQAPATSGARLSRHGRQLVAQARVNGEATVTLLFAVRPGAEQTVANGLQRLGATVATRDDDVGYLRAKVAVGKADQAAALAGVQAVDVDEVIALDDPRPGGEMAPVPQTPPGPATPRANPYMPIRDTGAADFTATNPTWDGRGTTVGVLDTGIALDHPALQTTTTGQPKVVDWITATHPFDDEDPTWVSLATQVSGSSFTVGEVTYTAPAAGTFRFGLFDERDARLGGEVGSDVNRDGNPTGSSGTFGVLWDGGSRVWVDADQDRSFADEPAMTDYRISRQVGQFGTDNPGTAVKEAMPFVVQLDSRNKVVNIGIVAGAHGSHVAGIVAANGMFGGAMSGAAPGAQLVSIRVCMFVGGCTAHAMIEGMIYAVKTAKVNVINMSVGGLPALNDGNNARATLYNRLIDRYKVQMYFSAGNSGPGENTIGDPSVASDVMSMGSYASNETWQSNYGSSTVRADNIQPYSSRGPREDGGFKPDAIAPGSAISTTPLFQPGGPVAGTYVLPPGYSMFNGTSMASPQAAGAGALLVSAAKQANVPHDPPEMRQALRSSAFFLPDYGGYEQGNGLLNVPAAWSLLATKALRPVAISASVPVRTSISQFLATPHVGVGINDREGVTIGQPYTRTYTFTRTNGPTKPVTYQLSLVGNDGTFSLGSSSIVLAKFQPTTLTVTVNPTAYGTHSAILNIDDPSTPGIEDQTMNTVMVAHDLTAANDYSLSVTGLATRNQADRILVRVPPGAPAFKVDFSGPSTTPGTGQARFLRYHPWGVGLEGSSSLNCYIPAVAGCDAGNASSRTAANPTAGVWELTVEGRRSSDVMEAPFSLTASVLGASVSPDPDVIATATAGVPVGRSYTMENLFGAFVGRAVGTALGSAAMARPTIADLDQDVRFVDVPEGSTSLRATIGNTSDAAADLDLYVFNCTNAAAGCVLADQDADGDSEESVTIANPAKGTWAVLVDGFAVPSGSTAYDYVDVFSNPAFGSISVTDANAERPAGSTWTSPATVTANAAPAAGRVLLGNVEVRTDANVKVGSNEVVVQAVS
jgi:hypothetical protein